MDHSGDRNGKSGFSGDSEGDEPSLRAQKVVGQSVLYCELFGGWSGCKVLDFVQFGGPHLTVDSTIF